MIRRLKMSLFHACLISILALTILHVPATLCSKDTSANRRTFVRVKRKMAPGIESRWPDNTVPYDITNLPTGDRKNVRKAMEEWSKYTCITFRQAKQGETRVIYKHGRRLSANPTGYSRRKNTTITLPDGASKSEVLHEIGHALGYFHEHERPDRDDHVHVIKKGRNYDKVPGANPHGMPYDYLSIMHYPKKHAGKYAILPKKGTYKEIPKITVTAVDILHTLGKFFEKHGVKDNPFKDAHAKLKKKVSVIKFLPTTDAKEVAVRRKYRYIGQGEWLSFWDIQLANHVYRCSGMCEQKQCGGNGYLDKHCTCQCESGKNRAPLMPCAEVATPSSSTPAKCRPNTPHDDADCEAWAAKGECDEPKYQKWMLHHCRGSCDECGRKRVKKIKTCKRLHKILNKIKRKQPTRRKIWRKPTTSFELRCKWNSDVGVCGTYLRVLFTPAGTRTVQDVCNIQGPGAQVEYSRIYQAYEDRPDDVKCSATSINEKRGFVKFTLSNLKHSDSGTYMCIRLNQLIGPNGDARDKVTVKVSDEENACEDKSVLTPCELWKKDESYCGYCNVNNITKLRPKLEKIERKPSTSFTLKCKWASTRQVCGSFLSVQFMAAGTNKLQTICDVEAPGSYTTYWCSFPPNKHRPLASSHLKLANTTHDAAGRVQCSAKTEPGLIEGVVTFTLSNLTLTDSGTYFCKRIRQRGTDPDTEKVEVKVSTTANDCVDKSANLTICEDWVERYANDCTRGSSSSSYRLRRHCQRSCGECDRKQATCLDDKAYSVPICEHVADECQIETNARCARSCGAC